MNEVVRDELVELEIDPKDRDLGDGVLRPECLDHPHHRVERRFPRRQLDDEFVDLPRLRGVPRNRGASRRPQAIRRLGRIETPDAWVLRHVESKITARRMGGKRSPRKPDLGDDRATQNVAEPGSPRGPAPGTAGTRGPTSRIPPQAALHPRVPVLRPVTPGSSGPGHPAARVPSFAPAVSHDLSEWWRGAGNRGQ